MNVMNNFLIAEDALIVNYAAVLSRLSFVDLHLEACARIYFDNGEKIVEASSKSRHRIIEKKRES